MGELIMDFRKMHRSHKAKNKQNSSVGAYIEYGLNMLKFAKCEFLYLICFML